jgi:hypothetical protein
MPQHAGHYITKDNPFKRRFPQSILLFIQDKIRYSMSLNKWITINIRGDHFIEIDLAKIDTI